MSHRVSLGNSLWVVSRAGESSASEKDPNAVTYDGPLINPLQRAELDKHVAEKRYLQYHALLQSSLQEALSKLFVEFAQNRPALEAKWEQENQTLLQASEGTAPVGEGVEEVPQLKKSHSRKEGKHGIKSVCSFCICACICVSYA